MSTITEDLEDEADEGFEFSDHPAAASEEREQDHESARENDTDEDESPFHEQEEDTRLSADARGEVDEEVARPDETANERLLRNQENRRKKKLARALERQEREELREANAHLARRVEEQERTTTALRIDALTANFNSAVSDVERFTVIMQRAEAANNAIDWQKAKELRDNTYARARDLEARIQQLAAPRQQNPSNQPHPNTIKFGKLFADRNPWFDWGAKDEDSAIVFGIDATLKKSSGLQPHQPEYWEELERRVRSRLPNKTQRNAVTTDTPTPRTRTPTPPVGGGRSDGAPRSAVEAKQLRFSAAERQALEDAGYWGDTEKMQKMRKQWDSTGRRSAGR
jgi:hypothetical protein